MITNPAFSKSDNRPVLLRLAQHDGRVVRPWRDKGVARRLGGSVPVVVDRWEPPPFPHEVPRGEPGWSRPRAAGRGDVARVVLHDSTDAVWLDEVFDKGRRASRWSRPGRSRSRECWEDGAGWSAIGSLR